MAHDWSFIEEEILKFRNSKPEDNFWSEVHTPYLLSCIVVSAGMLDELDQKRSTQARPYDNKFYIDELWSVIKSKLRAWKIDQIEGNESEYPFIATLPKSGEKVHILPNYSNKTIGVKDLNGGSILWIKLKDGVEGFQGIQGIQGIPGPVGSIGLMGVSSATETFRNITQTLTDQIEFDIEEMNSTDYANWIESILIE